MKKIIITAAGYLFLILFVAAFTIFLFEYGMKEKPPEAQKRPIYREKVIPVKMDHESIKKYRIEG